MRSGTTDAASTLERSASPAIHPPLAGEDVEDELLSLGGEPGDPQKILVALAERLVREIGPVTRLRVSGLGDHARSLSVRARISEGSGL